MRYKNQDSCSQFGIQSFIDEFILICNNDYEDIEKMKDKLIIRLKTCIMDRLYEQQYFIGNNEHIKNHVNIIKVYFDLYSKLNDYFDVLYILILSGKGKIKKFKNKGNFTNSLYLEIDGKELLPFTDVDQDLSYLYKLDLGKSKMSKYNMEILIQNTVDWSENHTIKNISDEIKKRDLEKKE
jgi:hypothetical protein